MSAASYTSQNPLWQVTFSLPAGLSFEYKYIITGSDGSITWETGDNNAYTVPSTKETSVTASGVLQSSATASAIVPVTGTVTSVSTPTPTQQGMATGCTVFYVAKAGDTCSVIASDYDITLSQFYTWNPAVGDSCASLWVGYYHCVSQQIEF